MLDIRNAYLILLFIYTFVIFVMIMIRDYYNNNRSFIKSLNLFNACLFIFVIGLIINIVGNNFYDKGDWYSLKNVFLAKGYCAYLFSFIIFLTSYYSVYVFNFDLWLIPGKNKKSLFYFIYYIVSLALIFVLPITISIKNGGFAFEGPSVIFTIIFAFSAYSIVVIEFIKNIKNTDYFKTFSPFLFLALIILAI